MVAIPGYRIEHELGRGGMATVYLAVQLALQRPVALKLFNSALLADDPQLLQRFLREGRLAARLRHRHIVAVHTVGEVAGQPFLAMEYLRLGSLAPLAGQLDLDSALRCIAEIAEALAAAHSAGIVHRDVKPENILRHEDGRCLLSDFGIARVRDSSTLNTGAGCLLGTPAYISPEQWLGRPLDRRADFYSLGVTLYQLATGRLPYVGRDPLLQAQAHLHAALPQLPPSWQSAQPLLAWLMAKDPRDRAESGAAVSAHIAALQRSAAGHAQTESLLSSATPTGGSSAAWPLHAGATRSQVRTRRSTLPWRRWILGVGAIAALIWGIEHWPADPPGPGAAVASSRLWISDCSQQSEQDVSDALKAALADELARRLQSLPNLQVGRLHGLGDRDRSTQPAAADLHLRCHLRRQSDASLRLELELSEKGSDVVRWNAVSVQDEARLLQTVPDLLQDLFRALQLRRSEAEQH